MLSFTRPLSAAERLSKATSTILSLDHYHAMGGVLMIGDKKIVPGEHRRIDTAATNGRDEFYNEAFVDSLGDAQLRFVLVHESKHKVYRHLTVWEWMYKENPQLANAACDYVINLEIMDENKKNHSAPVTMPVWTPSLAEYLLSRAPIDQRAKLAQEYDEKVRKGETFGLVDERFRGMNTKQVYEILKEEAEQNGQANASEASSGDAGATLDSHLWDEASEMSEAEQRALEREIDQALRQGALTAGATGADVPRNIKELLQPRVDRSALLREFLTEHGSGRDYTTWSRPNRRHLSQGVYMPSTFSETPGEFVFAADTSGSVSTRDLSQMLGELVSLCKMLRPRRVHILYWGHKVAAHEIYGDNGLPLDQIAQSTRPQGGGGTDPQCLVEYMAKNNINPACTVVLTDGVFADPGKWTKPVLWMVTRKQSNLPKVGKAVHI